MPPSKLSPLQEQVLIALSGLLPSWTLTGGAALAGFHTNTVRLVIWICFSITREPSDRWSPMRLTHSRHRYGGQVLVSKGVFNSPTPAASTIDLVQRLSLWLVRDIRLHAFTANDDRVRLVADDPDRR